MSSYLEHPLLQPGTVEKRLFQLDLALNALRRSELIVLPTGLGKTVIALMVLLARLDKGKAMFLAPTKPLVDQHATFLGRVLKDPSIVVLLTGEIDPVERARLFEEARIIVATPQVIENDLLSKRISLADVSLIIFDEAHRAVGNYAYVFISERYKQEGRDRLVLGITASPGSEAEKIGEICLNLGVEKIETKGEDDPDVAPFIHRRDIEWVKVTVPDEILLLRGRIEDVLEDRIHELNDLHAAEIAYGGIGPAMIDHRISKKELLQLQSRLSSEAAKSPNRAVYMSLSILAEVMKLKHAVELAETQGVESLVSYFSRLDSEARSRGGSKASRRLMEDPRIQEVLYLLANLKVEHPKLAAVRKIIKDQLSKKPDSRIMVFTNYRDTATSLLKYLKTLPADERSEASKSPDGLFAAEGSEGIKRASGSVKVDDSEGSTLAERLQGKRETDEAGVEDVLPDVPIKAARFVGQSSRSDDQGLSQKNQAKVLLKFRSGEYNVIIATSVGEEGIDIPATDMVLFYEPVPSEIRSIQRKGRTGRARAGRVVVMIAKGTRDEAYYWISERKERTMRKQIQGMTVRPSPTDYQEAGSIDSKGGLDEDDGQQRLNDYSAHKSWDAQADIQEGIPGRVVLGKDAEPNSEPHLEPPSSERQSVEPLSSRQLSVKPPSTENAGLAQSENKHLRPAPTTDGARAGQAFYSKAMISGQTHLPISGLHPEAGKFHEEDAGISKEGSDVKQSANIDGVKASEEATSRIEATGDRSAGDLAGGDLAAGDGTARDQAANGEMASNDAAGEKNAAPVVLVDPRERDVARKLIALGVDVRMTALEVGDYVVSDRVGIERKTAVDFISSLVSPHRELFRQIGDLSRSYERPVMILEGRDLYSRQIHPNAVRGALSAIAVDYSVPIIPTYDQDETAAVIALLARREQSMPGNSAKAHGKKTARTLSEQQEYLISSIPSVGPAVAKNLLRHFGSIAAIMNASTEELMRVEKVGKKTALRIRELVGGQYKG